MRYVPIDVSELEAMVEGYTSHVTEAVSSDEDAAAYVAELEQRADMIEESVRHGMRRIDGGVTYRREQPLGREDLSGRRRMASVGAVAARGRPDAR